MSDEPDENAVSDTPVETEPTDTVEDPATVEPVAEEPAPVDPATDWASHPDGGLTGLYEYFSGELAKLRDEIAKLKS
jgi:hypothetical protein